MCKCVNGHRSSAPRLYASSLEGDAELAYKVTRGRWGVESMHWTLVVTFGGPQDGALAGRALGKTPEGRNQRDARMFTALSKEARLEMLKA